MTTSWPDDLSYQVRTETSSSTRAASMLCTFQLSRRMGSRFATPSAEINSNHHQREDKGIAKRDTLGGTQQMTIINRRQNHHRDSRVWLWVHAQVLPSGSLWHVTLWHVTLRPQISCFLTFHRWISARHGSPTTPRHGSLLSRIWLTIAFNYDGNETHYKC